jgi:ATP-dependent 26S proteasome regulatory subunit
MEEMMNKEEITFFVNDICRAFNTNPSDENRNQVIEFLANVPPDMAHVVFKPILDQVQILHSENQHLKRPPNQLGIVMDPEYSNGARQVTALLKTSSGKPFVSGIPSHMNRNDLRAGSQVTLTQDGAMIDVGGPHQGYKVGKISHYCATRHEVRIASSVGQGEEELVLLLADEIRGHEAIKIGARVRYDPELRLATAIEVDDGYNNQAQTILDQLPDHLNWDRLILSPTVKDQIEDMYEELLLAIETGDPLRWLMVVEGPPGIGKTLLAQTLAIELSQHVEPEKLAWIVIKGTEPVSTFLGQSEANIRGIWSTVRENSEKGIVTIVLWDEIEATFPQRGTQSNMWPSTITNTFLSEIDGLNPVNNVVFIATTNRADLIEPALLRPNRLGGHILQMERPGWIETEQIFEVNLDRVTSDLDQPAETLAQQAASYIWAPAQIEKYPLAVASFKDGGNEAIPRAELVSGDMVRGAIDAADHMAKRRKRHGGQGVITIEDICWF